MGLCVLAATGHQNHCPVPQPWALALTWPLDCDLEFPTASTLGEHLEVSHLFHTHAFGLQASPSGTAGIGITGWGRKKQKDWVMKGPEQRPSSLSLTTSLCMDLLTPPRYWTWLHAILPHAFCVHRRTGTAGSNAELWAEIWCRPRKGPFLRVTSDKDTAESALSRLRDKEDT